MTVPIAFFISPVAAGEEGSCWLQALNTDIFVIVHDLDRDGNRGEVIWEGRLNQGQRALIKTPHGRFRYYINTEPDKRNAMNSGEDRWCDNGETVGLP